MEETTGYTPFKRRYVTIFLDRESWQMLVEQDTVYDSEMFNFPFLQSAAIPHLASKMNESFERAISKLTKVPEGSFNVTFLYASINEMFHRHIPPTYVAMFECSKPVQPLDEEFIWVDVRDLRRETLPSLFDVQALPYARRIFEECSENGVRPWEKPGWFKATCEVATATLGDLGYRVISTFEQFNVMPHSAVLRVETDKGRVYLKASNRREGKIAECLSSIDPKLVRKPLYVDADGEWMLMEDYGPTLKEKMTKEDFENLRDLFAGLKQKSSKHLRRLMECGVPRVDPERVLRKAEKMLRDVFLSEAGGGEASKVQGDMKICDEKEVQSHCRYVRVLLKHLYENQNIPLTIHHGDLNDENIIKCGCERDSYVIFDWEFASIDLPFYEIEGLGWCVRTGEEISEECMDSYLEHWVKYESLEELKRLSLCLNYKHELVRMITHYEYAVDKGVRPYLDENDLQYLIEVLESIQKVAEEID